MKFCQVHFDRLKAEISDRGLWKFVAQNAEEANRRMRAGEFEPLIGAVALMVRNAIDEGGEEVTHDNDDGSSRCPICFLNASCSCGLPDCSSSCDHWFGCAADMAFEEAKRLNLLEVQ